MNRYLAMGLILAVSVAGCGQGGAGLPVIVGPEGYQPIRPQSAGKVLIELPDDGRFAIHDKRSSQNPGPNGTAASSADARADGTASCKASASQGGTASSAFIVGAALHNDSDQPLQVSVTCEVEYEYAVQTTALSGGRETTGQVSFVLEAREQTTGKLLCQHPVATLSGYENDFSRTDQQRMQFVAEVSPNARWQVVLQGSADVKTSQTGQADVWLQVDRCRMIVKPLAAPASQPRVER